MLGASVTLSGDACVRDADDVLDVSWPNFAGPDDTPALPKSDTIQINATPGA